MNWGKGIIIAMTAFIGFIIYLVVVLMSHKVDLETEDYYQQEVAYETEIQAIKNASSLKEQMTIDESESNLIVKCPEQDFENIKVTLQRPDDAKADKTFDIVDTKTLTIPKSELKKGRYNITISYSDSSGDYIQKEKIVI